MTSPTGCQYWTEWMKGIRLSYHHSLTPMRTACCLLLVLGMVVGNGSVAAQSADFSALSAMTEGHGENSPLEEESLQGGEPPRDASLFYVVGEETTLYNKADSTAPVAQLPVRTPVHRLDCSEAWCQVRTEEGRTGYVSASSLSNVWIRVSKEERHLYLYRGPELVEVVKADVGYNAFSDKERRGSEVLRDHWRTPEGTFYVIRKNPDSQFYKALVLNYPTVRDAERGVEQGLISQEEYAAISRAQKQFRLPPMNTDLGGWIEIHGDGTGSAITWTQGCVAVSNQDMNELWPTVRVGTPVLIE